MRVETVAETRRPRTGISLVLFVMYAPVVSAAGCFYSGISGRTASTPAPVRPGGSVYPFVKFPRLRHASPRYCLRPLPMGHRDGIARAAVAILRLIAEFDRPHNKLRRRFIVEGNVEGTTWHPLKLPRLSQYVV